MSEEQRAAASSGRAGTDRVDQDLTTQDLTTKDTREPGVSGAGRGHVGHGRDAAPEATVERAATYREIFASHQFRALYAATVLSWLGDYVAKAGVTALVYRTTGSVWISAATFAIGYIPWVLGGPVLAALAERYPYRTVMIICDVARALVVAVIAIPGLPVPVMLALLFVTAMINPPFEAARSALMPYLLDGDRYVQATLMQGLSSQAAQFAGYLLGSGIAVYHPHVALLIDSSTFACSAMLVALFVRARRPALEKWQRTHLLRETAQGFGIVFGRDALRAISILIFTLMLFTTAPEGLAAAWADHLAKTPAGTGLDQGLIMAGYPGGFILGGLVIGRLLAPPARRRLIRFLAVLAPLALVPALLDPPAAVVAVLTLACGFAVAGFFPAANGMFVRALPNAFRARAFGVMQSGVQVLQGVSIVTCGALANHFPLPTVVGLWSLAGALLMVIASTQWPSQEQFANAYAEADEANGVTGTGAPVGETVTPPRMRTAESV